MYPVFKAVTISSDSGSSASYSWANQSRGEKQGDQLTDGLLEFFVDAFAAVPGCPYAVSDDRDGSTANIAFIACQILAGTLWL